MIRRDSTSPRRCPHILGDALRCYFARFRPAERRRAKCCRWETGSGSWREPSIPLIEEQGSLLLRSAFAQPSQGVTWAQQSLLVTLWLLFALVAPEAAGSDISKQILTVFQQQSRAVVTVFAQHRSAQVGQPASHFVGTGFFISRDGYVVTAANVVFGADRVWVESDEVGYLTEVAGLDRLTNVAILRLKAVPPELHFLRFPTEAQLPPIGTQILSISSELGMAPGPSLGLVTGRNTTYGERVLPTVYLRTSLDLSGGENGAPVFDLNGNLLGMAIIGLPETRSSFVLPIRALERVRDDVLFSGEVTFAHFGFTTIQIPDQGRRHRVVIEAIEPDGPAASAGILVDDTLRRVGAFSIERDDDLRQAFFFTRPQENVEVVVERGGQEVTLRLLAGQRERPPTLIQIDRSPGNDADTESEPAEAIPEAPTKNELPTEPPMTPATEPAVGAATVDNPPVGTPIPELKDPSAQGQR